MIADDDIKAAYERGLAQARQRAGGNSDVEQELIDAATSAVMWALEHCRDATTFRQFAASAVRRWIGRQLHRIKLKNRPNMQGIDAQDGAERRFDYLAARDAKPERPMLIEDLPEELGFVVRLYMVDGYTLRDIGMLVGKSPNTVALMLKEAASMLAPGREAPTRNNGEKRLTAG